MKDTEAKIYKKKFLRFTAVYAIMSFVLLVYAVSTVKQDTRVIYETVSEEKLVTEYIYVNNDTENDVDIFEEDDQEKYLVKEHMKMIGIFLPDGKLHKVLEVYVETLPEADRRLLEEGFEIIGKTKLNSIIEDYTG